MTSQTIADMKIQWGASRPISTGKLDTEEVSGKAKPQAALVLWLLITNTNTCPQFQDHSSPDELSRSPGHRERGTYGR